MIKLVVVSEGAVHRLLLASLEEESHTKTYNRHSSKGDQDDGPDGEACALWLNYCCEACKPNAVGVIVEDHIIVVEEILSDVEHILFVLCEEVLLRIDSDLDDTVRPLLLQERLWLDV